MVRSRDLKREAEKIIEMNRRERKKFLDFYIEWIKKTPNKVWSKQQAEFINSVLFLKNKSLKSKR